MPDNENTNNTDPEILLTQTELESYVAPLGGVLDYDSLSGRPSINNHSLVGENKPGSYYDLVSISDLTDPANLSNLLSDFIKNLVNTIYPVGSIYISTNSTSPNTLFPDTTWVSINGKFLFASNSGFPAGSTGGSPNITLPKHSHTILQAHCSTSINEQTHSHRPKNSNSTHFLTRNANSKPNQTREAFNTNSKGNVYTWTSVRANGLYSHDTTGETTLFHRHRVEGETESTGTTVPNNNMPPYLVVYMWKRTA